MPLFDFNGLSYWRAIQICIVATATGDMAFMAAIYLVVALVHGDLWWIGRRSAFRNAATWSLPVIVGMLLAISFELWAVHVARRWSYGSMPIVPVLGVGVTPLLQMIVIPLATLGICYRHAQ